MIEFNRDGSIKLPDHIVKQKSEKADVMKNKRAMLVQRELTQTTAPKKCTLKIKLSDQIFDNRFMKTIFEEFKEGTTTPAQIKCNNLNEFEIEIGSDFRRCTECNRLIGKYREFIGKLFDEKGACTFETRRFEYEDYFD